MWWTGIKSARAAGFAGFKTVSELRKSNLRDVPKKSGVYLMLRVSDCHPTFLPFSTGGHFKGRNPTVDCAILRGKWVDDVAVLYVGKAGGDSGSTLLSRLKLYLNFGAGKPVGHWGGRYIWQIADADSLLVCWKETDSELPLVVEQSMLDEFAVSCDKLPFANCRR